MLVPLSYRLYLTFKILPQFPLVQPGHSHLLVRSEQSHYVTVQIQPARATRFVRLLMHFDLRWIMISEVHFDTEPVRESHDEEEENEGSPATIATASVVKTGTATLPLRQCRLELVTEETQQ